MNNLKGKWYCWNEDGKELKSEKVDLMVTWGELSEKYPKVVLTMSLPEKKNARLHYSIDIPLWVVRRLVSEKAKNDFIERYNKRFCKKEGGVRK